MPAASKLQEAVRRRRAAGGPAEQTFAALVGLELRPRRLRDASVLWGSLRSRQGHQGRDAVWAHPDLLPRVVAAKSSTASTAAAGEGSRGQASHPTLESAERAMIVDALERAGDNKSKAARLLGLTRAQLRSRLEKHGL